MFDHSMGYTPDGLFNRLLLSSKSDKWNIVVEDKNKEYEYEPIFKRLLGNAPQYIIFALGGKTQVLGAYARISAGGYPSLESLGEVYLLDGDFDFVNIDENDNNHSTLIYLDRYDIENYLIDKVAIESFSQGKVRSSMKNVETHVEYSGWFESTTQQLHKLFVLFYLVQKNELGIENVGKAKHHFFDATGAFNEGGYLTYMAEVKQCLEDVRQIDFDVEMSTCQDIITRAIGQDISRVISGKHYIFSIIKHLKNKDCYKTGDDDFRWWLISNINTSPLMWLKERFSRIMDIMD